LSSHHNRQKHGSTIDNPIKCKEQEGDHQRFRTMPYIAIVCIPSLSKQINGYCSVRFKLSSNVL
jgi:hypothetical protein